MNQLVIRELSEQYFAVEAPDFGFSECCRTFVAETAYAYFKQTKGYITPIL
jgi:hypothetical protein